MLYYFHAVLLSKPLFPDGLTASMTLPKGVGYFMSALVSPR